MAAFSRKSLRPPFVAARRQTPATLKLGPPSFCGALPRRRYAGPAVIQEVKVRTCDMGGKDSTLGMAKAIAAKL